MSLSPDIESSPADPRRTLVLVALALAAVGLTGGLALGLVWPITSVVLAMCIGSLLLAALRPVTITAPPAPAGGSGQGSSTDDARGDHAILEALHEGLGYGWLRLDYQPIVAMDSGVLAGIEALARLDHPELGVIPPRQFLPVARDAGLMDEFTAEVITLAVGDARRWNESFPDEAPVQISVNLVESQASAPHIVAIVQEALEGTGVSAGQLRFELSDSVTLENMHRCIPVLRELLQIGVELSIDHFGSGGATLAHLRLLSFVSELKIDRAFIEALETNATAGETVAAIAELGAAIDARIVAEGVETIEQWEILSALGVTHAQGFYLARPQRADRMDDWAASEAPPVDRAAKTITSDAAA